MIGKHIWNLYCVIVWVSLSFFCRGRKYASANSYAFVMSGMKENDFLTNFRRFTQIFRHFNANFLHFLRVFFSWFFEAENTLVLILMFFHVSAAIVFSYKYSKKIT